MENQELWDQKNGALYMRQAAKTLVVLDQSPQTVRLAKVLLAGANILERIFEKYKNKALQDTEPIYPLFTDDNLEELKKYQLSMGQEDLSQRNKNV